MLGPARARQFLTVDLALQFHESVQQRFWPRGATGNININRNVTVDSFEHVIALLKRPAGNGARPHRSHPDSLSLQFIAKRLVDFAHRFRCNNVTLLALLTTALASPI